MMRTTDLLFLTGALLPAIALAATSAACPIERGAVNGSHVWLLCEQAQLLVSVDSGSTWQTRRLPSEAQFRAIWLLDSRRGFVGGNDGALLATEDGAETWRKVQLPARDNLTSIHFVGELGWIAGWTGLILHSSDGGRTWLRQQSGILQGLEGIYFADEQHGWAVGWAGTILRTEDGGQTWSQVRMPKTLWSLDSVYFSDTRRGWAVGFGGQILTTSDGGVNWQEQNRPVQSWLRSVSCDRNSRCWIAADHHLLVSEDRGETWKAMPVEGMPFLHQVLAVEDSLWAIGQFGILKQAGGEPRFTALATLPSAKKTESR